VNQSNVSIPPDVEEGLRKSGAAGALRHLFLCVAGACAPRDEALALWETLKERIKERAIPAMRTKADCLRVCAGGPWLLVHPEGVWYGGLTKERLDRIVEEHLEGGVPVMEWVAAAYPLCRGCPPAQK
jgi:(2Fe-2S) ferredoxin